MLGYVFQARTGRWMRSISLHQWKLTGGKFVRPEILLKEEIGRDFSHEWIVAILVHESIVVKNCYQINAAIQKCHTSSCYRPSSETSGIYSLQHLRTTSHRTNILWVLRPSCPATLYVLHEIFSIRHTQRSSRASFRTELCSSKAMARLKSSQTRLPNTTSSSTTEFQPTFIVKNTCAFVATHSPKAPSMSRACSQKYL